MKIPLIIIPIDGNGYHIMARGNINGLTANILIDTGATRTVLDLNRKVHFFDSAPLVNNDKYFTGVGTEKIETRALVIPQLSFGTYSLNNLEVVVINLEGVNKTYATYDLPRIDMVLGGDVLFKCGCIIDYPNSELTFSREFSS